MSFLNSFFGNSLSYNTVFNAKFERDYDEKYHTIVLTLVTNDVELNFNIDVLKADPSRAVLLLKKYCEQLTRFKDPEVTNESVYFEDITFDGDVRCFFRPGFVVSREFEPSSVGICHLAFKNLEYCNTKGPQFNIRFNVNAIDSIINEFENVLNEINNLK